MQTQAYENLPIVTEQEVIANLCLQLETLNRYLFTDNVTDKEVTNSE